MSDRIDALANNVNALTNTVNAIASSVNDLTNAFNDFRSSVDKRFNTLEKKVDHLDTAFNKLKNSFDGYTQREGEIFEITTNDAFAQALSANHVVFEQLSVKEIFPVVGNKAITEFDGIFLVNITPQGAFLTPKDIERRLADLKPWREPPKLEYKNSRKLTFKPNVVKPHPKLAIVVIEAKHDVDKRKVDQKIKQLYQLENLFTTLQSDVTKSFLNNASTCFKNMYNSPDFQKMIKVFNYDPTNHRSNIHLYLSANNWTHFLKQYMRDIFDHSINLKTYSSLTKQILETHDRKFLQTIQKAGNEVANMKKSMVSNENANTISYITNFTPTVEYVNQIMSIQVSNAKKMHPKVQKYYGLVTFLKTFTTPFEDLHLDRLSERIGMMTNEKVLLGTYGFIPE